MRLLALRQLANRSRIRRATTRFRRMVCVKRKRKAERAFLFPLLIKGLWTDLEVDLESHVDLVGASNRILARHLELS